jgi:hypothetical protein
MTERQARDRIWRMKSRAFRVGTTTFLRNDVFFIRFLVTLPGGVETRMVDRHRERERLYEGTLGLIEDVGFTVSAASART